MKTFLLKISLFLLSLLLLASSLSAQEKDSVDYRKHVLKAGISIQWNGITESGISYERHLKNKTTLSYGFLFGYNKDIGNEDAYNYSITSGQTLKAVFQYRHYIFQSSDLFPEGFYVGGITNFQHFYEEGHIYPTDNNATDIKKESTIDSGYLGIGPLLGYHFLLFNKLSLDINTFFHYNLNIYQLENKDGLHTPKVFTFGGMFSVGYAFGSK